MTVTQLVLYAGTTSTALSIIYSILPTVETFNGMPRFQKYYGIFLSVLKQLGGNLRNAVYPAIKTDGGSKVSAAAATGQNPTPTPKEP
jgi:hypothetical protein